ncbi:MAG: hypothetical protein KAK00_03525 [Nanoarchaeota archaeon]|nr:hypothetical protein [Nanoarchaeota archaeon]
MVDISKKSKRALEIIFRDFSNRYNAHNIHKKLGATHQGADFILKSLKEKKMLLSETIGRAIFYKINLGNEYAAKLLELILMEYEASSFIRGWICDLTPLKDTNAIILILYGSIINKGKKANDLDLCIVLNNKKDYDVVQDSIDKINRLNIQKIHPLYLTKGEFKNKIHDKIILEIIKEGIILKGCGEIVEAVADVTS